MHKAAFGSLLVSSSEAAVGFGGARASCKGGTELRECGQCGHCRDVAACEVYSQTSPL
jgi:hypothetical protein